MRFTGVTVALAAAAIFGGVLRADETPAATPQNLGIAVEEMLSTRESAEALEAAITKARELGATEQAILEARFLFHVDRREDAELAAMAPGMLAQRDKFRLSESQIFAVKEDWLAVVEYVQAIAALQKDDREGFKKHITEAFWLSPRQGAAFAPHIERLRLKDAMAKARVDFNLPLPDLAGRPTSIGQLAGDNKAVLLHFFSPWSRECEESMADLRAVAKELAKHGIALVSIVGEPGPEALTDTNAILGALSEPAPGAWVADHADKPLSRLLRIESAPSMVLVEADGKIRFNGHPADDELWKELRKIAPECRQPRLEDSGH
ncbi:alkylhydroperoxide reductase/thiol protein [Haloferula helveola]|uniref:Alkylhydroperoxide reductase/thiol protein n=1 Tax=Haloferula helveola TaxID=490095 RepID=A0ABM7RMP8_9BACT|nr:alkylhydroperoxide reductase/thiol protein [Haloferula helveola]